MIYILSATLCLLISSCAEPKVPQVPPTQSQLNAITSELDSWGEGRWNNWKVSYLNNDETILVRIAVDPSANEIAMNTYIKKVKEIIKKHARKYDAIIRLLKYGDIKKTDYVFGK